MPDRAAAWTLTLPCTRGEAEALEDALEPLFAPLAEPPVLSFAEDVPDDAGRWTMQAFFARRPSRTLVAAIHRAIPSAAGAAPLVETVEPQDWVTLSQSALPPVAVGRFHVRNRAEDAVPPDTCAFLIPASRAFGTGQHVTTFGCLATLDRLRAHGHRFGNIADVGTGTGLLAFAALALWPRAHVLASDIDPDATAVITENMTLNGVPFGRGAGRIDVVTAAGTDHPAIRGRAPYDLVVANILAGPLIALAPALAALLADGGSLLLAGLLDGQAGRVVDAYRRAGLRLAGRQDREGWPVLHLRKRRRAGWRRPARGRPGEVGEAPGFGSW